MVKFKDGLKGNLTIPELEVGVVSDFQTNPLTAFHQKDKNGNLKIVTDPSAAVRGRNFDIENKK